MTNLLEEKSLTRDRLRQLIASARKHVTQEQTFDDAAEYNWEEPHHFNPDQILAMKTLGKKIESQIAKTFSALCQGEFNITISSITQHFACQLAGTVHTEQQNHYFLPFSSEGDNRYGYLDVSPPTALILVGQMLRDTDSSANDNKEFSQLEETILLDITSAIVDSVDAVFIEQGGPSIQKSSALIRGDWPLEIENLEDLCRLDFSVDYPDGNFKFTFTILSDLLEPLLGMKSKAGSHCSTEEIHKMMIQSMYDVPIEITAQLYSSSISLSDMMSLSAGDILLLEKKIKEPLDVLFNKSPCLKAYPAASNGKNAVVIAPQEFE